MRTRIPFIEAFRKQQENAHTLKPESTEKVERDLSPKSMSHSYHRVVGHVRALYHISVTNGT
jgi:acyl-coenzyme A thioesterase 9